MTETNPREEKGKQIALKSDLIRVSDNHYHVHSQTSNRDYDVIKTDSIWIATVQITFIVMYAVSIFTPLNFHSKYVRK